MDRKVFNESDLIFTEFRNIFSFNKVSKFLFEEKNAIFIFLSHYKAKSWPRWGESYDREGSHYIPVCWAIFYSNEDSKIVMDYSVHPTKCLPKLYNKINQNAQKYLLPLGKLEGKTLGGCGADVYIAGNPYPSCQKTTQYCSAFGLPDDCYEIKTEREMITQLQSHKDLKIWCFDKTEYIEKGINLCTILYYMQKQFLPTENYFYIDKSGNFLRGVMKANHLRKINEKIWYPSGGEFYKEMDPSTFQIFEEDIIDRLEEKLICEFIRQSLLLINKDEIKSSYKLLETSKYRMEEKPKLERELKVIKQKIENESTQYLNTLLQSIRDNINYNKLKKSRLLVMDVEYTHIKSHLDKNFSSRRNFPSMISNIVWNGPKKGFSSQITISFLPCNICDEKPCDAFNNHMIRLKCLHFAKEFVNAQKLLLEKFLSQYENFKIYTYGNSDINEIECAFNFVTNSSDYIRFKRKNRKIERRVIEVFTDLAEDEFSLSQIETEVLSNWILGWKRIHPYIRKKNRHFMRRLDNLERWREGYYEILRTCIQDAISSFLYLLYKEYRKNEKPIKPSQYKTLNDLL